MSCICLCIRQNKIIPTPYDRKRLAETEARCVDAEREIEARQSESADKDKMILALQEEVENLKELDKIKDVTSQLR